MVGPLPSKQALRSMWVRIPSPAPSSSQGDIPLRPLKERTYGFCPYPIVWRSTGEIVCRTGVVMMKHFEVSDEDSHRTDSVPM